MSATCMATRSAATGPLQAWVVSITPFTQAGALDEAGLRAHFARLRSAGIGVYVGSSNAGEGFTLSGSERDRLFEIAAEELKGRVPVRAGGCEPQSVAAARSYLRAAARAGLDAAHLFQLDTGHAGPPRLGEIEHYYAELIGEAELPIVISSYPKMGYELSPELAANLLTRYPQIVAFRDAGDDANKVREYAAICRGRAAFYTGGIRNLASALFHGSEGFLSAEANLAPALAVSVLRAFAAGDTARLRDAHDRLWQLHQFVNIFGGAAGRGIKPLLNALGLPGGALRSPRLPLSAAEQKSMLDAWRRLDLVA